MFVSRESKEAVSSHGQGCLAAGDGSRRSTRRSTVASAGLVVLFYFINLVAQRIPLRPLFIVTSAFLFVMAIRMLGDAVQEFQEQQLLPYDALTGWRWMSSLGLNPTVEAVAAQAIIIALAGISFLLWRRTTFQEGKQAADR